MLVKILLHHEDKGYRSIQKRMTKGAYQRLLSRIGQSDGRVTLLQADIIEQ